ncbi:hypothetical protein EV213_104199 [Aureibacillus halotolerans]|uniref:Uncharacterized protein n=1 Tax=Aureibacillus halotolerans TaxID=1508390 RepID=A0A4R6U4U8_9BACI|nr:hypothetical protein EV213_104199 [Aureibacillus halotolerans]
MLDKFKESVWWELLFNVTWVVLLFRFMDTPLFAYPLIVLGFLSVHFFKKSAKQRRWSLFGFLFCILLYSYVHFIFNPSL